MTNPPEPRPRPDPEAAAVERLLRQLQHVSGGAVAPRLPGPTPSAPPPPPSPPQPRREPSFRAKAQQSRRASVSLPSIPGVWARIVLAALLGVALTQWPYPSACGAGFAVKVAATSVVALAGIWAAAGSWRRRLAGAHVMALLITTWGLALITHQVLPRTYYWSDPTPWLCPTARQALNAPPPDGTPGPGEPGRHSR